VYYYVRDIAGNRSFCTFNVKVVELQKPTIVCPANVFDTTKLCTKAITITAPSVSDNCGVISQIWRMSGATVAASPTTGINNVGTQTFNRGVTTISYTVKDGSSNLSYCTQQVTVTGPSPCGQMARSGKGQIQEKTPAAFKVNLLPNPAAQFFKLNVESFTNETLEIIVYAANGKKIEQLKGRPSQVFQFGEKYRSGTYMIEVRQGTERKTVIGVKL
jgi:hypothetical protein